MSENFLHLYMQFAYYLCFVPYRLVKTNHDQYVVHSYWPQKILCGICHFLALYVYLSAVRYALELMTTLTPVTYFRLFESILSCLYKIFICKCLWSNQETMLKIANFHQNTGLDIITENKKGFKMRYMVNSKYVLLSYYIFSAIVATTRLMNPTAFPLTYYSESLVDIRTVTDGALSAWYTKLTAVANDLFFQNDNSGLPALELSFQTLNVTYSGWEIALSGLTAFSLLSKYIMGLFTDVFVFMVVLTLHSRAAYFEKLLNNLNFPIVKEKLIDSEMKLQIMERNENTNIAQSQPDTLKNRSNMIIKYYESLRKLSKLVNQCIGPCIIPLIGEGLLTYAINLGDVLFLGSFSQGVVVLTFYLIFMLILTFSAMICAKVKTLKEWLYDNIQELTINNRQLTLLLDSIEKDSVGISVSGILTVNFSFIGTLVGMLMTYFIIRLQYKEN